MFYEDLFALRRSTALAERVAHGLCVVNAANTRQGVRARRGDGSFGEIVPNVAARQEEGYEVPRGPIATIEIGIEVKILAKSMIKQIDRVKRDLTDQVAHFKSKGGRPITIGIVGINHAAKYISFEGDVTWATNGKSGRYHPYQEAEEAERRLLADAAPAFDEFLILHFRATNHEPPATDGLALYDFEWVDEKKTAVDYGAVLARVSQRYEAMHRRSN